MAVRATPIFIDGNTHPAEETRLATQSMLVGATGSFAGGVAAADPAHGVGTTSDLAVSANATPNMTVNVAAGGAFIRGTQSSNQGAYHLWNDATVSLAIDAADATNPRRDLVIAQVRDSNYSGSDDDARLVVVTGTPAAVPTDPSLSSYPNALVLARVTVAANDTAIGAGDITDLRTLAHTQWQVPAVASTTERDRFIPSPTAGQLAYLNTNDTAEGIYAYNGTTWVREGALVPHTTVQTGQGASTSNTTASTSYVNLPTSSDLTFTKNRADTILVVQFNMTGCYSSAADYVNFAVRVGSTDYLLSYLGIAANVRHSQSGVVSISGVAAGSVTCRLRVRMQGGFGGTLTVDTNTYYSMSVTETYP